MLKNLLLLLRPQQWLKNGFIFLPLFFDRKLFDGNALSYAVIAFFAYSFAASGIYCMNDLIDVESDKKHPQKCKRPIASGAIAPWMAVVLIFCCIGLSACMTMLLDNPAKWQVAAILVLYFLMNIAYCLKLKQQAIVDVFIIAVGFVLRIFVGGFATGTELSQWIVLMTLLLALFLAFAKRRDDVILYESTGILPRKTINRYNLPFMNQVIGIVASITMVCYIMYTVSDEVVNRINNSYLYVTSVFVLAGIIRYLQVTMVDLNSGSPTKVLIRDKFIFVCIFCWIMAFAFILYL